MDIKLYTFGKKTNSTKQPTDAGTTKTGILLEPFSLDKLTVKFQLASGTSVTTSAPSYNYAYISKFSRYYFITGWSYSDGFWFANMEEDHLASYKTNIGNSIQFIVRSESSYDAKLKDSNFIKTKEIKVDTVSPRPNPDTQGKKNGWLDDQGRAWVSTLNPTETNSLHTLRYVLTFSSNRYYIADGAAAGDLPEPANVLYPVPVTGQIGTLTLVANLKAIQSLKQNIDKLRAEEDPYNKIMGMYYYPFCIDSSKVYGSLYALGVILRTIEAEPREQMVALRFTPFGASRENRLHVHSFQRGTQGESTYLESDIQQTTITLDIPKHPQEQAYGSFLSGEYASHYDLYLPFYGTINLPANVLQLQQKIKIYVDTYLMTGNANIKVVAINSDNEETDLGIRLSAQIGVPMVMTGQNYSQLNRLRQQQANTDYYKLSNETLSQKKINYELATLQANIPTYSSSNTTTGQDPSVYKYPPALIATFEEVKESNIENVGRPLEESRTINTLSGFVQCSDVHLDFSIPESEKAALTSLLESGFYYE